MSGDLNAGYVGTLLEQYLENPEAVDPAWRRVFEGADNGILSALPGLSRLIEMRSEDGNGGGADSCPASDCAGAAGGDVPGGDAGRFAGSRPKRPQTGSYWQRSRPRWRS